MDTEEIMMEKKPAEEEEVSFDIAVEESVPLPEGKMPWWMIVLLKKNMIENIWKNMFLNA